MLVDTAKGTLSVPELELYEKVGRNYSLEKAKEKALELVEELALSMGAKKVKLNLK